MGYKDWQKDPEFQALPQAQKFKLYAAHFDANVAANPQFSGLPKERQAAARRRYMGEVMPELGGGQGAVGSGQVLDTDHSTLTTAFKDFSKKISRSSNDSLATRRTVSAAPVVGARSSYQPEIAPAPKGPGVLEQGARNMMEAVGSLEGVRAEDIGRSLGVGLSRTGQLLGRGLDVVGLDSAGQAVESYYKGREQEHRGKLSEAFQREKGKEFIEVDPATGKYKMGKAWTSLPKILSTIVESAPSTALGMGTGMGFTAGLTKLGVSSGLAGIIGGALGEGGMAGAESAKTAYDTVIDAPIEQLSQTKEFKEAWNEAKGLPPDQRMAAARKAVASTVAMKTGGTVGALTGVLGAPSGHFMGKALGGETGKTMLRTALKQAGLETLQEMPQSAAERLVQNITEKQYVDPDKNIWEGVGEAMAEGGVSGFAMGFGMGGGSHVMGGAQVQETGEQKQETAEPMGSNAAEVSEAGRAGGPELDTDRKPPATEQDYDDALKILGDRLSPERIAEIEADVSGMAHQGQAETKYKGSAVDAMYAKIYAKKNLAEAPKQKRGRPAPPMGTNAAEVSEAGKQAEEEKVIPLERELEDLGAIEKRVQDAERYFGPLVRDARRNIEEKVAAGKTIDQIQREIGRRGDRDMRRYEQDLSEYLIRKQMGEGLESDQGPVVSGQETQAEAPQIEEMPQVEPAPPLETAPAAQVEPLEMPVEAVPVDQELEAVPPSIESTESIESMPSIETAVPVEQIEQEQDYEQEQGLEQGAAPRPAPIGPVGPGVVTMGGRIAELGGMNKAAFGGEFKQVLEQNPNLKRVFRRSGQSIDQIEQTLKEEGWLLPDENLLDMMSNDPGAALSRGHSADMLQTDYRAKRSEAQQRMDAGRLDQEAPGEIVTRPAESLEEGETIVALDPRTGQPDEYTVTEKDPFGVTLKDGIEFTVPPGGQIDQVMMEEYAIGGRRAAQAPVNRIDQAKEMFRQGASANTIWRETGWAKGPYDGKWRFEIDDSAAALKNPDGETLGEVLDHPDLFRQYPELAGIETEVMIYDNAKKPSGTFFMPTETEGAFISVEAGNAAGAKSALLHEIQHAIQQNEDFATGDRLFYEHKDMDRYRRSAGETEAMEVQARADMTAEEKAGRLPYDLEALPLEEAEVDFALSGPFSLAPQDAGLTLEDVQDVFKGQKVTQEADGSFRVDVAGRPVIIQNVERIDVNAAAFEIKYRRKLTAAESAAGAAGSYKNGTIKISQQGDKFTLHHESYHLLEDMGLLTKGDIRALNKAVDKQGNVTQEDRALLVEQALLDRAAFREGTLGKVIQKIGDFFDGFVNLFTRTERGVLRDIESGAAFDQNALAPDLNLDHAQNIEQEQEYEQEQDLEMYSVKPPPDVQDLIGRADKGWLADKLEGSWVDKVMTHVKDIQANPKQRLLDRFDPLKKLGDTVYRMHRLSTGASALLETFFKHGKINLEFPGTVVHENQQGFLNWMKQHGADASKFLHWAMARRAEQIESEDMARYRAEFAAGNTAQGWEAWNKKNGREKWLDADARQKIDKWVGPKPESAESWNAMNDQFMDYNRNVLEFAVQSELVSRELANQLLEKDFYMPFYRLFEEEGGIEMLKGPFKSKKHIDARLKKLMGAKRKIGDPVENIIKNWSHLITESVRNAAMSTAFDSAIMNSVETTDADGNAVAAIEEISGKDVLKFRESHKGGKKTKYAVKDADANVISFNRLGKKVYAKVNDANLFNALTNANAKSMDNLAMRLLSLPKRLLTFGATNTLPFVIRNTTRDTLHTSVISKGFTPFWDTMRGAVKVWKEDADYVAVMSSMAGFGSDYMRSEDPAAAARYVEKAVRSATGKKNILLNSPQRIWAFWSKVKEMSEMGARVQQYANMRRAGEAHFDAAFEARDLLDFSMRGDAASVQFLIQTIPFLNARFQGLYKIAGAARKRPLAVLGKGLALTGASLLLWMSNRDREEYKQLEDWEKRMYYHIFVGDYMARIPKPFEVGAVFSTFAEAAGDAMAGDEDLEYFLSVLWHTLTETFMVNPVPQAVKPVMEQWANKSMFTGRPIVGRSLEGRKAEYQYDDFTSDTMVALAGKMGISPKRAESIVRGYTAGLGMAALGVSDIFFHYFGDEQVLPDSWLDAPVISAFLREKGNQRHTKYESRVYEIFSDINEAAKTVRDLEKLGETEDAAAERQASAKELEFKSRARKVRTAMSGYRKEEEQIRHSNMGTERKRDEIERIRTKRQALAKSFYEDYKQWKGE